MVNIRSSSQLLDRYTDFLLYVTENDFTESPTHGCFCRWLARQDEKLSVKKAQNLVARYIPTVKKEMTELLADVLSAGALKGKYNATITTLCLKNLCDWSDKHKTENTTELIRWEELIDGLYTNIGETNDSNEEQSELG